MVLDGKPYEYFTFERLPTLPNAMTGGQANHARAEHLVCTLRRILSKGAPFPEEYIRGTVIMRDDVDDRPKVRELCHGWSS